MSTYRVFAQKRLYRMSAGQSHANFARNQCVQARVVGQGAE